MGQGNVRRPLVFYFRSFPLTNTLTFEHYTSLATRHQVNAHLCFSDSISIVAAMAPKRRAARCANIASSVLPSIETDGNPASPPPASSNSAETAPPQRYKSWTLGPLKVLNPRDKEEVAAWEKKCLAWERKHFGERYYELNEAYLHEKDYLQDPLKYYDMWKEMRHIEAEKTTEHEREKKAALGD
jgi:hypothetical protein